ncbi:MAG: VanZ family protein [Ferruginibacter sp.]
MDKKVILKMKPLTFKSFIPGIAWFFVVLTLICLPGGDIPEPSGWFEWIKLIQFDKLVHSGIFALLAFLFMRPFAKAGFSKKDKWNYFLKIALATCIWGLTTELIQKFFIPTRQFDLVDWAADSIGTLIALLFCRWFFLKRISKNSDLEGPSL